MSSLLGRIPALTALVLAVGLTLTGGARAADQAPVVILVVDYQRVIVDSKAGKAISEQMKTKVTEFQQSVQKQDSEFVAARQELQRQQSILAQDAFAAKVKEFEQRYTEAGRKAQESERTIGLARDKALGQLEQEMIRVVSDLAKERSANLVLNRSTIILYDNRFDVTEEVVKRLDEKLPSVAVNFSGGGDGGAPPAPAATGKAPKQKPPKS